MATEYDNALSKAKRFVTLLNSNGFEVSEAYLFGSAAENRMNEYSDIDIAVVSDKFTGMPFYDVLKISKFRRSVDLQIEVHPFSLKEIRNDPPLFFVDIKKKEPGSINSVLFTMDNAQEAFATSFDGFRQNIPNNICTILVLEKGQKRVAVKDV